MSPVLRQMAICEVGVRWQEMKRLKWPSGRPESGYNNINSGFKVVKNRVSTPSIR
jgi:hypothetical protein